MPARHRETSTLDEAPPRAPERIRYEFVGLDILRLVACLSVLIYHYSFRGAAHDGSSTFSVPSIQAVSKYGFFGVYLFFMISGFVIAYSAKGRTAKHFFISRFVRLYPAFIVCMPLSFIIEFLFGRPEITVTLPQLAANTIIISPLFHQSFVDGVYWSIVCEIIFYGWVLIFLRLDLIERRATLIVLAWLGLSALNEAWLHSTPLTWLLLTKYSGFFAVGVMLHVGRFQGWTPLSLSALLGAVLLGNLQLFEDIRYHNAYYPGIGFDAEVAVALCLISVFSIGAIVLFERCKKRPRLALIAGGITYPLYLIHQNIGYTAFNRIKPGGSRELFMIDVSSMMILAAWAIWRFIETPTQRFLRRILLAGPANPAWSAGEPGPSLNAAGGFRFGQRTSS